MRISEITTRVVNGGLRNWVFVKVVTDCPGLHGWGEATLEWKTRAVAGAVDDLAGLLIGEDPRDITRALQILQKWSFWRLGAIGQSAASAIEMALWDILGKELGVPVWRLLGGKVREKVRVYAHLGMGQADAVYHSFSAEALSEHAARLKDAGYGALKIVNLPYSHYLSDYRAVDQFARSVHDLRSAMGPDMDIMIDFHGRPGSPRVALDFILAIQDARILFVEEPIGPGDHLALAHIRSLSPVAIAAGERLIEASEFEDVLSARAVDVIQPDLCHCGGLSEGRRIAQRAELLGIGVAPHNPAGPIAGAAALHFAVATPNHVIQEEMSGAAPWYDEVVASNPIKRERGYWAAPRGAGLGVEIDEAVAIARPFRAEPFETRNARMHDGGIVNW